MKIKNDISKQNRTKENLYALLEEKSFNKGEFISRLNVVQEKISQLEQDYKDQQSEILEAKEMTGKIKKVESFKHENQMKISRDLRKLSLDDRKRLAENMFSKISISKDNKDEEGFKMKYYKYGPVTILDQFIKEGRLPSLDLNGFYYTSRIDFH